VLGECHHRGSNLEKVATPRAHVIAISSPHGRFAGNKGKTNFPLGAEAVGVVVAVGPDISDLQVSAFLVSYTLPSPCLFDGGHDLTCRNRPPITHRLQMLG